MDGYLSQVLINRYVLVQVISYVSMGKSIVTLIDGEGETMITTIQLIFIGYIHMENIAYLWGTIL